MADIATAAFCVFFMQTRSVLTDQCQLEEGDGRSNRETLFGLTRFPSDNQIHALLDPASSALLHSFFTALRDELHHTSSRDGFARLNGHATIALDRTEYFCSGKIHCGRCSRRLRSNCRNRSCRITLGATLVAPSHTHVVRLAREFVTLQNCMETQNRDTRAARQWLVAHGAYGARLNRVYLGDALCCHQLRCDAALRHSCRLLLVCKPASHPLIAEYLASADWPSYSIRVKDRRAWFMREIRWVTTVPLRGSKDALAAYRFEVASRDPVGRVTSRSRPIINLSVDRDDIAELAACGRIRWKTENKTFNGLKSSGYYHGHDFGHEMQNVTAILVTLSLVAFSCHNVFDLTEPHWQIARAKAGSGVQFFPRLTRMTALLIFSTWNDVAQDHRIHRAAAKTSVSRLSLSVLTTLLATQKKSSSSNQYQNENC